MNVLEWVRPGTGSTLRELEAMLHDYRQTEPITDSVHKAQMRINDLVSRISYEHSDPGSTKTNLRIYHRSMRLRPMDLERMANCEA